MSGSSSTFTLIAIAIAALALLVVVAAFYFTLKPRLRGQKPKERSAGLTRRRIALDDLSYTIIHDVRVRDAKNKVIRVDHVIRLPASVLLVTSAPADIAGPVKLNQNAGAWRYVAAGGRVADMSNPVLQLRPLIQAVRLLTVFPDAAQLSSVPRTVCMADDFIKSIKEMATEDGVESQAVEAAWEPLSKALLQSSGSMGTAQKGGGSGTAPRRAVS
jgi:hypothetical protein